MSRKIKAVVFDMDGILIDSEPIWRKAEIKIFSYYGVPLTEDDCRRLMGLRTDEVVKQIAADFKVDLPLQKIESEIIASVSALILSEGVGIQGFCDLAIKLRGENVPLAVATSSPMRVVNAVLQRTGLHDVFSAVVSAEKFPYGKPHPQVYMEACEKLGFKPVDCLAIEDSLNGTLSAKAARMMAISIPERETANKKGFGIADFVIERPEEAYSIIRTLL